MIWRRSGANWGGDPAASPRRGGPGAAHCAGAACSAACGVAQAAPWSGKTWYGTTGYLLKLACLSALGTVQLSAPALCRGRGMWVYWAAREALALTRFVGWRSASRAARRRRRRLSRPCQAIHKTAAAPGSRVASADLQPRPHICKESRLSSLAQRTRNRLDGWRRCRRRAVNDCPTRSPRGFSGRCFRGVILSSSSLAACSAVPFA